MIWFNQFCKDKLINFLKCKKISKKPVWIWHWEGKGYKKCWKEYRLTRFKRTECKLGGKTVLKIRIYKMGQKHLDSV